MKTVIDGTLLKHAERLQYTDGTVVIRVLLAPNQTGALPVLAERAYGSTPSASFAAANAARDMRKGTPVVVHGESLSLGKHDGGPVVRIHAVSHIGREAARMHHEPDAAQAA